MHMLAALRPDFAYRQDPRRISALATPPAPRRAFSIHGSFHAYETIGATPARRLRWRDDDSPRRRRVLIIAGRRLRVYAFF